MNKSRLVSSTIPVRKKDSNKRYANKSASSIRPDKEAQEEIERAVAERHDEMTGKNRRSFERDGREKYYDSKRGYAAGSGASSLDPEKRVEERRAREAVEKQRKETGKQIGKKYKKALKNKARNIKQGAKKKVKKAITMNEKKGKAVYIQLLFLIALIIAGINDGSDIFLTLLGLVVSLTGIGLALFAIFEVALKIFDIITVFLLSLFIFYVGGSTKVGKKMFAKIALVLLAALAIELVPILQAVIASWVIVVLWNWYDIRKRAEKAGA